MSKEFANVSLLLFALIVAIESRQLPFMTGFEKSIIVDEKTAMAAYPAVTDNESLVYAVCDQTEPRYRRKTCNLTIETPAFVNASFKDTCAVHFAADNVRYNLLSGLVVYSFGDERVLAFWRQEDTRDSSKQTKFRIIKMLFCEVIDVPIVVAGVAFVVIYDDKVELGLLDEKYCDSPVCKVTVNEDGQLIDGPTKILVNADFDFIYALAPVSRRSPNEGFYVSLVPTRKNSASRRRQKQLHHLYKVYWDGVATRFAKMICDKYTGFSNSYGHLSVCESTDNTTITCRQYDASMSLKLNGSLSFLDYGLRRWLQPHNLQDGSLLLATGAESSSNSGRYESFQLIMLYVKKQTPLTIEGLDFKCRTIGSLRVHVLENDVDEICLYLVCDRRRGELRYSVKCLPKSYLGVLQRRPAVVS